MAIVQGSEIVELIVDGGESAKNLNRPGMERLLALGALARSTEPFQKISNHLL